MMINNSKSFTYELAVQLLLLSWWLPCQSS